MLIHKNTHNIKFSIDRGGTFTDVYAEYGDGKHLTLKLLSEDPQNYNDAPSEGIRRALEKILKKSIKQHELSSENIERIRMGTTVATNALLERKGVDTALLITKGFKDLLQIGYQNRPYLFDLKISKPSILYKKVIEVDERIRPVGPYDTSIKQVKGITGEFFSVLKEPDLTVIEKDLIAVKSSGINAVAIVFLHAYSYPDHELRVFQIAKKMGFKQISLSSKVMPMIKAVPRGDTTVVDSYLTPHIKKYLKSFRQGFADNFASNQLHFMQSDGGLSPADKFSGSNAILSGPAGGVVGFALTTSKISKGRPVIGFDMGGTSTDVSRYAGEFEITHETETAGVRIQAPQLQINTVAAGGGSRLFYNNAMFTVGPESSGAHPGPVCYRKNGFLSITDANLLLGRIQEDYFPHIFGEGENQPLDKQSVKSAFNDLAQQINADYHILNRPPMSIYKVAAGYIEIANQTMARAIREISTMRGYDIKDHMLATFGGAGGQHACAIARILGIKNIFIHRLSGILSAYGLELADVAIEKQQPASFCLSPTIQKTVENIFIKLEESTYNDLQTQGFRKKNTSIKRYVNLRFEQTDNAFMVLVNSFSNLEADFRKMHIREFGFDLPSQSIIIDDIRIRALGHTAQQDQQKISQHVHKSDQAFVDCFFEDHFEKTPVFNLKDLGAGFNITGPALIVSSTATIVIEPDCELEINQFGDMLITIGQNSIIKNATEKDPILLSIFSNLFMSIAEQMGRTLQCTSISTNIKERLDYSCAIFDKCGNLVANAPHIPVHLGAMSAAVKEQIRLNPDMLPGDVFLTNHPASGGSHLPDLTVITPVWQNNVIVFFTASRGHHADIGGLTPGSMPPFSKTLKDEGACITSFKLVKNFSFDEEGAKELLKESRKINDNISDLKAQVAANQKGISLLLEMVKRYGLNVVWAYMGYIQECAEMAVKDMLKKISRKHQLDRNVFYATEYMDDGTPLCLQVIIDNQKGTAVFDFTGTGPQVPGNLNTPISVVFSSILYCLRCLTDTDLPLNQGCLAPIKVIIPKGTILSPFPDAAVVGGNVLTSQRITDLILKVFDAAAASQGCMNNITFGNASFGYYETIGGGAGAGPNWHGQSGVHTHMTNTRITDPEIFEKRYPVMINKFSIRENSGGKGEFCGGNGLIREYEALDYLKFSILSERRVYKPFGLNGGESGSKGVNLYIQNGKEPTVINGKSQLDFEPGERLQINTPGGGGFGKYKEN